MTDLDAALAATAPAPEAARTTAAPRRCSRHRWEPTDRQTHTIHGAPVTVWACGRCGRARDEAASRQGRRSVSRSKREERAIATRYGGRRVGHLGGPEDVVSSLFAVQSKAGTGWWSKRYADELDKLPRAAGRLPMLVVSNGEPGALVRRYVVMDERDFRDLHGAEAGR